MTLLLEDPYLYLNTGRTETEEAARMRGEHLHTRSLVQLNFFRTFYILMTWMTENLNPQLDK